MSEGYSLHSRNFSHSTRAVWANSLIVTKSTPTSITVTRATESRERREWQTRRGERRLHKQKSEERKEEGRIREEMAEMITDRDGDIQGKGGIATMMH